MRGGKFISVLFVVLGPYLAVSMAADEDRWWPEQKLPRGIVRTPEPPDLAQQVLVQSVAGLAAKSVNQGKGDELVWVENNNTDVAAWFEVFLKNQTTVEPRGTFSVWDLVERFSKRGIIKGYILYSVDNASVKRTTDAATDVSINVATSLAGIVDGVVIPESLEAEARTHGLEQLLDVRGKTHEWCFDKYKSKFNRRLLLTQSPHISNVRDLAVAHQALVLYGTEKPLEAVLKWMEPLSPIAGWNSGDEFTMTRLASIYGHVRTPTDWCANLPVLMADTAPEPSKPAHQFDPKTIHWDDRKSCVSFILTDGDNVQWYQTTFFHGNPSYWNNPDRGKIAFGWSCCFTDLVQLCPAAMNYALTTQTPNDRFIEWGGSYYYPDLFGQSRPNRAELLAKHARRTWKLMQRSGTKMIGFLVSSVDSPEALRAFKTIARETEGLTGMFAVQYSPYEGGQGKTFWVKDRRGVEIPVISARYSIWEHSNDRPRTGTPAKIAREIREHAKNRMPNYEWVSIHAWSYFQPTPGSDENAEDVPERDARPNGAVRGYSSAMMCAERLPADVRLVPPEELIWRIRMKHDSTATKRLLGVREE